MMFITPTPPTIKPTLETAIMKSTRPPVSCPQSFVSESGPKISKLSSACDLHLAPDAQHVAYLFLYQRFVFGVVILHAHPHVLVFRVQIVECA